MTGRSVALTAGRSRKPSRPSRCQRENQVGQLGGCSVEDEGVGTVVGPPQNVT